jgi:anti-sigma regulatory factor (Ser/Thr protein kinase)
MVARPGTDAAGGPCAGSRVGRTAAGPTGPPGRSIIGGMPASILRQDASAVVPLLAVSRSQGDDTRAAARRVGINRWFLALGPAAAEADRCGALHAEALPSWILGELAERAVGDLVQVAVELDACGAWVTVANAGPCRPVVVRRAGWVDLRGHPTPPLGRSGTWYADDRIGLGPGDAVVFVPPERRVPAGNARAVESLDADADDDLLDRLLELTGPAVPSATGTATSPIIGPDADAVDAALGPRSVPATPTAVMRVPDELGPNRRHDLARALGVPVDRLELPGYPLGDQQPDLWSRPPLPPRLARLRLPPDLARVGDVRGLLRRLLGSWRLTDLVALDDVELLASETATNAVRYGGGEATVTVRYDGRRIRVSVSDRSPVLPRKLVPAPLVPGGRGLHLVHQLSSSWGTTPAAGEGKTVWFEVPVDPPADI